MGSRLPLDAVGVGRSIHLATPHGDLDFLGEKMSKVSAQGTTFGRRASLVGRSRSVLGAQHERTPSTHRCSGCAIYL
jgi:hypothetical protein